MPINYYQGFFFSNRPPKWILFISLCSKLQKETCSKHHIWMHRHSSRKKRKKKSKIWSRVRDDLFLKQQTTVLSMTITQFNVWVIERTWPLHAVCCCCEIIHDSLCDTKKWYQQEELLIGILLFLVPFDSWAPCAHHWESNTSEKKRF